MYNKLKLVEEFESSLANFFNEEYVNSDVQKVLDETEDVLKEDSNNQLKKAIKTIGSEIEDYDDEDFDGDGEDDIDPDELDELFMGGDDEIVELSDEEELDTIENKRLKESYDRDDQLIDYLLEDYSSDDYYLEDLEPDCESDFEMVNDLTDYSFDEEYDTIDSLLYSLDEDYLDEDCYDRNDIDDNDEDFDEFDDFDNFDEDYDLLTEGPIRVIKKPDVQ